MHGQHLQNIFKYSRTLEGQGGRGVGQIHNVDVAARIDNVEFSSSSNNNRGQSRGNRGFRGRFFRGGNNRSVDFQNNGHNNSNGYNNNSGYNNNHGTFNGGYERYNNNNNMDNNFRGGQVANRSRGNFKFRVRGNRGRGGYNQYEQYFLAQINAKIKKLSNKATCRDSKVLKLSRLFLLKQSLIRKPEHNLKKIVHAINDCCITDDEKTLLTKGASFTPTPNKIEANKVDEATQYTLNRVTSQLYFNSNRAKPPIYTKRKIPWQAPTSWAKDLLHNRPKTELQYLRTHPNLNENEKRTLRRLLDDKSRVVVQTDKNMGLAIMNTKDYIDAMNKELGKNPEAFTKSTLTLTQIQNIRNQDIKDILTCVKYSSLNFKKELGNAIEKEGLGRINDEPPTMFGLPKIHKPNLAMRLVLPLNKHPLSIVHSFLAKTLDIFVQRLPNIATHSLEIKDRLLKTDLDINDYIYKADIIAMYPNIEMKSAVKGVLELLNNDEETKSFPYWKQILEKAFNNIEFKWDNEIWILKEGVPIGSPCGPQLAILSVSSCYEAPLSHSSDSKLFIMYYDDAIGIHKSNPHNFISNILPHESQPRLRFDEPEIWKIRDLIKENKPVDMLDLLLKFSISVDKIILKFGVYTKPMGAYQYVHWTSGHQQSVKEAVPKGEYVRRFRICNDKTLLEESIEDLRTKLRNRGYPNTAINNAMRTPQRSYEDVLNDIKNRRMNTKFPWGHKSELTGNDNRILITPIVIPFDPRCLKSLREHKAKLQKYIDDSLEQYQGFGTLYRKSRTLLAFTRGRSLGQSFRKHLNEALLEYNHPNNLSYAN